jgi:hypothetical protein
LTALAPPIAASTRATMMLSGRDAARVRSRLGSTNVLGGRRVTYPSMRMPSEPTRRWTFVIDSQATSTDATDAPPGARAGAGA